MNHLLDRRSSDPFGRSQLQLGMYGPTFAQRNMQHLKNEHESKTPAPSLLKQNVVRSYSSMSCLPRLGAESSPPAIFYGYGERDNFITRANRGQQLSKQTSLSKYGSRSLARTGMQSDKEVYEVQQAKYNIISMEPHAYKRTIKLFPTYRKEILCDQPHAKRQAFISGKPQFGLAYSKINGRTDSNAVDQALQKKLNPEHST